MLMESVGTGQIRSSKLTEAGIKSPTIVQMVDETAMVGQTNLGVWWPNHVYKELEGQDIPKELLEKRLINDTESEGMVRDIKHGQPPGTTTLSSVHSQKVVKIKEVETSSRAIRKGQLEDTFNAARDSLQVGVKRRKLENGE